MQEDIKPLTTDNAVVKGGGKKVRPKDDVVLVATGNAKFYKEGEEFTAHSALVDKLVAKGFATVKGESKKEGKK